MIVNATLLRIDRRTTVTAAGDEIFATGSTIAVPCFLDAVTSSQRYTLGSTIKDSSNALYIDQADAAAANLAPPAIGDRVFVAIDGESPQLLQVLQATDNTLGVVSHFESFTKKV